jgi:hypothetical protein
MGLEGFSNNASGGMSPGDHLYAKTFNKLAMSADKSQVGPSEGILYTSNNGGIGMYIPPAIQEKSNELLQQFQIIVEPYEIGGNTNDFSIIRVVKGEVVWSPKLLQDLIPLPFPLPPACTTQTTIENWFGLPTFPIIDDGKAIFIGDGGIRVPKVANIPVGIFIFKVVNLPEDLDPIIVAVPDFVPSCPVEFPGTPPVPGGFWEVVKIGSVEYLEPDPGANPPVEGGWKITQNFIGSMTLPGDGKGSGLDGGVLPAQLKTGVDTTFASPFQCFITQVNGERYLQIATGSVSYSSSNMPLINTGAFTHTKQAWFRKVQICPSGMRTDYNVIWPSPDFDPDPSFSNTMMEGGGGYKLNDTSDPVVIYAFKWDSNGSLGDGGQFLSGELPTLAILQQENSIDINKIQKDCGPSIYEQTMNVQPMNGYDHASTELPGDWGYCHTTWLNPRKVGYNYKAIATILPTNNTFACFVSIEQIGIPLICNTIQALTFVGVPSGGVIIFSYFGIPSVIPFPVTDTYTPFYEELSDEVSLFQCLNSIPLLTGNVQVSKYANRYYITFVNALQGQPVDLLVANTSGVTYFEYDLKVVQYHTGNLDLTSPMQMGMTQLMNKPGLDETDDPYNQNQNSNPAWKDIVNRDECLACKDFSGDVITDGVFNITGASETNPDFTIVNSCDGGICEHPFQVHFAGIVDEASSFIICSGMVNNIVPSNIDETITMYDGFIWLKCTANDENDFPIEVTVEFGTDVPADTDTEAYVAISNIVNGKSNQLLMSSLWADRIKVGTNTATYYYAGI